MSLPPSFALVLRPILRALLHDETALYAATRDAVHAATGVVERQLLDGQRIKIGAHLQQLAWQLGYWGDGNPDSDWMETFPQHFGVRQDDRDLIGGLEQRHGDLLRQVHRFTARTSWWKNQPLAALLSDLREAHATALSALCGITTRPGRAVA